ncbi:Integrase core domain-containing protein, partial [Porphyromonadaceae bacterium NLAE-zl-C104]
MEQIKSELLTMRLPGMAGALQTLRESRRIHELSFTDGLRILVQAERDQRETNRYKRLVKNASFRYQACIEELSFDAARGLDRNQVLSLANGSYIRDAGSILVTGATGCGKSFVASALGHQACRQGFSVMYFGMQHEAGDKMFVDYAGKKLHHVEYGTGEIIECEFFVSVLGQSQYTYAEASPSQRKEDFISSVQKALHYYGGVPKVLVPDNLKSAVSKSGKYDPALNEDFLDMANHYGCGVLPARSRKPRDKSLVENHIRTLYTRVHAELSQVTFFSLEELNGAILRCLEKH